MTAVLGSIIGGTFFVLFMGATCMYVYAVLTEVPNDKT